MATAPATHFDESTLTKGQRRKLNALRKSVGDEIGCASIFRLAVLATGDGNDSRRERRVDRGYPMAAGAAGHALYPARRLPAPARARTHHRRAGTVVAVNDTLRPPAPGAVRSE